MAGILRNVTSNWAGIILNIGVSFVLAPIIVNSLGTVHYGIWTLMMQFTGYLWLFDFGVRESVVKYVAQYHASGEHAELDATVRTALSVYTVVAGIALVGVVALTIALPYAFNIPADALRTAQVTALLTGATVALGFVFNVFAGIVMGLQLFYRMAKIGIVFSLTRAVLTFVLLSMGFGVITLAVLQFTASVINSVIIYRICTEQLPYLSVRLVRPARERVVKLLNYGKYVLLANIGDKVIFATDSIVIGVFLPISALTYFAIGGTLIEHFRSFITSLGMMLNPLSSSLEAKKDTTSVAAVLMGGAKAAILLGLPVCIGFILLGDRFIGLWMGPSFAAQAGAVLAVLAAGHLVGLPYYSISGVLYGLNQHRLVAWSRVLEGIVNLALSIVLVRRYGLIGVAVGTAIPHALVVAAILPLVLPRLLPIDLGRYYLWTYVRPFAAAIPFWFACLFIARVVQPPNIVSFMACVAAGLPLYIVPCWFLAFTSAERDHFRGAMRRRLRPAA
jgi:O-antigen/teichoic acid export membrane protein